MMDSALPSNAIMRNPGAQNSFGFKIDSKNFAFFAAPRLCVEKSLNIQ
jgi:hypothetical protein